MTVDIYASGILINEVLIDSSPQRVELYNEGSETIDVSGWTIDDSGGTAYFSIPQSPSAGAGECLVFEGDFNLNKATPDTVRLIRGQDVVDIHEYTSAPGAGISLSRLPDGGTSWATASASFGFLNADPRRSCLAVILTPTITQTPPTPTIALLPIPSASPNPTLVPAAFSGIYISELMAYPETGQSEWVEVHNSNDFQVFLSGWQLDDLEKSGSPPKTFSLQIPPGGYAVVDLASSLYNNSGDTVRLVDLSGRLMDALEFSSTLKGKSLGRTSFEGDDFCIQDPSMGIANNPCLTVTSGTSPGSASQSSTVTVTSPAAPTPGVGTEERVIPGPAPGVIPPPASRDLPTGQGRVLGIAQSREIPVPLHIRFLSIFSLAVSLAAAIGILARNGFFSRLRKRIIASG